VEGWLLDARRALASEGQLRHEWKALAPASCPSELTASRTASSFRSYSPSHSSRARARLGTRRSIASTTSPTATPSCFATDSASARSDRHARGLLRDGVLRAAGVGDDEATAPGRRSRSTHRRARNRPRGRLRPAPPLRRPRQGWSQREPRTRGRWRRSPLLLRRPTRHVCVSTGDPRQECASEATRAMGGVPANAVRPVSRDRDAPLGRLGTDSVRRDQ
jgi:hypothetical protein